jgi:hypothetical protein
MVLHEMLISGAIDSATIFIREITMEMNFGQFMKEMVFYNHIQLYN